MRNAMKNLVALGVVFASLLGIILAVSPQARAEVFKTLPYYWGDADGAWWGITPNAQFVPMRSTSINSTNTTLTSSSTPRLYLVNMSGNHTLTLPTVAAAGARARYQVICAGNNIGTTGNLTINVTSSGNINGIDALTVSNTSGATGAVQTIDAYADSTTGTNDWFVTVGRR